MPMRVSVDDALAGFKILRLFFNMNQPEIQVRDAHFRHNIPESAAIPLIAEAVVVALDQDLASVQLPAELLEVANSSVAEVADVQHEVVLSDDAVPQLDMPPLLFYRAFGQNAASVRPFPEVMVARHKCVVQVVFHALLSFVLHSPYLVEQRQFPNLTVFLIHIPRRKLNDRTCRRRSCVCGILDTS